MTASIGSSDFDEGGSGGLVLFGRQIPAKILGIVLGAVGAIGAGFLFVNNIQPGFDNITKLEGDINAKTASIGQKTQQVNSKGDLSQKIDAAKERNRSVLALLPSSDNIDTLVRDLSARFPATVSLSNGSTSIEIKNVLEEIRPAAAVTAAASAGAQYQTRTFNVQFTAPYPDAIKIMQNLELLKPQLVVKNIKMIKSTNVKLTPVANSKVTPERQKAILATLPPLLTISFLLEAYVPFSEAEIKAAEAAKAPAPVAPAKK